MCTEQLYRNFSLLIKLDGSWVLNNCIYAFIIVDKTDWSSIAYKNIVEKNKTSDLCVLNDCIYVLFIWTTIPMCWVIVYLIVIVDLYCYTLLYSIVLCRIQIVGFGGVFNADIVESGVKHQASLTHYFILHRTMLFSFVFLFVLCISLTSFDYGNDCLDHWMFLTVVILFNYKLIWLLLITL